MRGVKRDMSGEEEGIGAGVVTTAGSAARKGAKTGTKTGTEVTLTGKIFHLPGD